MPDRTDDKPHCKQSVARRDLPLVFLHGFLGAREDWEGVTALLKDSFACVTVDLEDTVNQPCHLIGYSMGGRRALQLKKQQPELVEKVVVLSGHPGLVTEKQKQARWKQDLDWIALLQEKPFDEFLTLWYNQPLFTGLKQLPHFPELLQRKRRLNPQTLIHQLRTFSLAKQEMLWHLPDTLFLYGEDDLKYASLYDAFIASQPIQGATHAIHLEKPRECAAHIRHWICMD